MFWTGHPMKGKAVCTHHLYSYTLLYTAASVHRIQLKKLLRIICLSLAYRKSFQVRLVRDGFWPECLCKAWRELMGADSQLLATITSLAWSAVTLSSLGKKDERLAPWTGNVPLHYHTTIANSEVSLQKFLMSRIMYAAPVTRNTVRWVAHHCHLEEMKF